MELKKLEIKNFRIHKEINLEFLSDVNILHGENGVGKTNIIEAIHYLCLTKSFLTSKDQYVLQKGATFFELIGTFQLRNKTTSVKLVYMPANGKKSFINKAPLDTLSEIVGRFPVVIFSPQDYNLTSGGPEERRNFLDNTLSQDKQSYLKELLLYRRILKQRNALLGAYKRKYLPQEIIKSWTEKLKIAGSKIIWSRNKFLQEFNQHLKLAYKEMELVGEEPTITYQTITKPKQDLTLEEINLSFEQALQKSSKTERERGITTTGPHRDELIFKINGFELRRYASHGQHRTFGMALQLAKYLYLENKKDEKPLLLLDDIFGDLDTKRTKIFLSLLQSEKIGQTIMTVVNPQLFENLLTTKKSNQFILIEKPSK